MESQIPRNHGHIYDEDPHNVGLHSEGEDGHHHEKKSVIKKVKEKAKKMKDTLSKHGHGHDEHGDDYNRYDEEADENEEETVEDPEVHGAPIYESAAIWSGASGQDVGLGPPRMNLERSTVIGEELYPSKITDPPTKPFAAHEHHQDKPANPGHGQVENVAQKRVNMGLQIGLEEDPHPPRDPRRPSSDPSNYQSKVTDPTGMGGEEAGITPILRSLDKMRLYEEPESKSKLEPAGPEQNLSTGSHHQFSPQPLPTDTSMTESFGTSKTENLPHDTEKPSNQSSYIQKISSASSAIADKAISTKNVVASKLGYGSNEDTGPQEMPGEDRRGIAAVVKEKLSPVFKKVAEAGSTEISKVQGTGLTEKEDGEKGNDKGVSMKQYLVEKLRPSDEDRALSEVISDALHKRKEEPERSSGEKPMGKVTESKEVARRLGTGGEDSGGGEGNNVVISDNMTTGMGVVDRLRDKVGSWFGKPDVS